MIFHGLKSNFHLEWWSLQKYKFGDFQNVDIFSRVLKDIIKSFQPWCCSVKN